MIKSKEDFLFFCDQDRNALRSQTIAPRWRFFLFQEGAIFYYQKLLRKLEFLYNKEDKNLLEKIHLSFIYKKFNKISLRYNFSIPINVFNYGLSIAHIGMIIVNPRAKIGFNCRIHPGTVIGEKNGKSPIIGNNVYLGPGVKIFGNVTIANNVKIGANAVVNKSILEEGAIAVGVPVKVIQKK